MSMQARPTGGNAGSWSMSRPVASASSVQGGGSQVRSWSQSSQGRRTEALSGLGTSAAPAVTKVAERDSRSPRPQTSRRALSYTQLQMASVGPTTNGASKSPIVQQDSLDEAQMANLRHSLLQHIQSVQKEIARLQLERQKNQQGFSESRGQDLPAGTRVLPGGDYVVPSGTTSTGTSFLTTASPTPTRTGNSLLAFPSQSAGTQRQPPLRSPQTATRGFSCERLSSEQNSERWRQPPGSLQREHQTVSSSLQGSLLAPAAPLKTAASVSVPVVTSNRLSSAQFSSGSVNLRIPSRWDGALRGASPTKSEAILRGPSPPRLAVVKGQSAEISPTTRSSLNIAKPAQVLTVMGDRTGEVASKLPVAPSVSNAGEASTTSTFVAEDTIVRTADVPAAATATNVCTAEPPISTKGKQISSGGKFRPVHLAASRIQRAWKLQSWRRRFVDYGERQCSWVGSLEWLQQHNLLYGTELASADDVKWWLEQRSTAPLDREVDPWGSERLLEHLSRMWYGGRTAEVDQAPQQQQPKQVQRPPQRHERQSLQRQEWSRVEQRSEDIFKAFAQQSATQPLEAAVYNGAKPVNARSHVVPMLSSGNAGGASHTLPMRAAPIGERTAGPRQVSTASMQPQNGKDSLRTVSALSPRTEGVNSGTPGAPNGNDALAARLKGVVLGAPPPSMHSYQRSYRVASHSPPQTHRTARATVPATPMLNSVNRRPRSPATTAPASSRVSLPHSSSMQMQRGSLSTAQRPASSMHRALSGSPPPSVIGRSPVASRR